MNLLIHGVEPNGISTRNDASKFVLGTGGTLLAMIEVFEKTTTQFATYDSLINIAFKVEQRITCDTTANTSLTQRASDGNPS